MKQKILFGVSGLGNGHTFRELPIIEHFSKTAEILIFAHDNSEAFYRSHFKNVPSVRIVKTAIPFYAGNKDGIDFAESAVHPFNQKDIFKINCTALDAANREFGKPNLVISDYEPISAQYAYMHDVPLVTIDQQSKYLYGDFPDDICGFTFKDEIARLHMLFPKVSARIALSFFSFPLRKNAENILLFPPTISQDVLQIKRLEQNNSILVYVSSAREFSQTSEQIIKTCEKIPGIKFHVFLKEGDTYKTSKNSNVSVYSHGDSRFKEMLGECAGIVATAGHSLLSEAMFLGIPVYAIPVSPYEQHMNASVIQKFGFGISDKIIEKEKIEFFIQNISSFKKNILSDKEILNRTPGQFKVVEFLEKNFLRKEVCY